ncbi:flagellar basal body rod protein FlgC [Paraburkholderia sp. SARCC-3016]|jgi:flagellar basal-body rod protein FlgC|uniref:flagellar basal body rod protein FlgC n=1 Tax=Paraburkholderia sp. SARCC-3016 TaxID=3058611 RepID=UPI002808952F|nr:flagellar basal body rod protein FlgC [Paraburkholderia sp. SARCC-3016]MDQ7979101.1 flagellar basal body rod protein FlgC [Paraburkholderia sp. SARCC-3016]
MSLMNIFKVAGSALTAESQRLNVTASNLANADSTTGPDGKPYRAKQVVFAVDPLGGARSASGQQVGGVQVTGVVDDPTPMKTTYDPSNPAANADGYVTSPNVDPVQEMVNMISASRSYQANIETLNTAKNLMLKTLTIGT